MAEKTLTHGLKYQARALCSVTAAKGATQWLVGSNSLRDENEVRRL